MELNRSVPEWAKINPMGAVYRATPAETVNLLRAALADIAALSAEVERLQYLADAPGNAVCPACFGAGETLERPAQPCPECAKEKDASGGPRWVLVPRQITPHMGHAGSACFDDGGNVHAMWEAMIGAAPLFPDELPGAVVGRVVDRVFDEDGLLALEIRRGFIEAKGYAVQTVWSAVIEALRGRG